MMKGGIDMNKNKCFRCGAIGVKTELCDRCLLGKNKAIENNFSYHAPKEGQPAKYEVIRNKAKEFAYMIQNEVPDSREKSLALTNLEQAVMWANAGIARN